MNNPGIDPVNWERLKKKWKGLLNEKHKLELEYRLICRKDEEESLLAIDVIQTVDDDMFTETVQHKADEGEAWFGIAGLSLEEIVDLYKEKLKSVYHQAESSEASVVVTMTPTSPLSGEVQGSIGHPGLETTSSFQVNYAHYYLLNALRNKMVELLGDGWQRVKVVYFYDEIEFYFDYGNGWAPIQNTTDHRPVDRRPGAAPLKSFPGIQSIVVQAVQSLFSREMNQKSAINCIRRESSERMRLALLYYSEGSIEKLRFACGQSHPHFWMDEISPIFRTMEQAEKWVKSISKAQGWVKKET